MEPFIHSQLSSDLNSIFADGSELRKPSKSRGSRTIFARPESIQSPCSTSDRGESWSRMRQIVGKFQDFMACTGWEEIKHRWTHVENSSVDRFCLFTFYEWSTVVKMELLAGRCSCPRFSVNCCPLVGLRGGAWTEQQNDNQKRRRFLLVSTSLLSWYHVVRDLSAALCRRPLSCLNKIQISSERFVTIRRYEFPSSLLAYARLSTYLILDFPCLKYEIHSFLCDGTINQATILINRSGPIHITWLSSSFTV